jgi:hypothetical protein
MNDKNLFNVSQSVNKSIANEESKRRFSLKDEQIITEKILSELNQLKRAGTFEEIPISSIRTIKSEYNKIYDFSMKMLDEINQIRKSPPDYAKKLESMMRYIKKVKLRNIFIFAYPGTEKVSLPNGTTSFLEVINILKETRPIEPLNYNADIKIDIDNSDCDHKILKKLIYDKRQKLKSKYPQFLVNLDIISNPVVSVVMQLIDDNPFQGQRRDAILNKNYGHFAVSQFTDSIDRTFNLVSFA